MFYRIPTSIITSQRELTIPKHTLEPGIYIIRLTAAMMNIGLSESDEKYMQILEEPIYVTLAGGSTRLVSWNEDIILNGSLSYDPNVIKGNARDLNFTWHCQVKSISTMSKTGRKDCLGFIKSSVTKDSFVKRIPAKSLIQNATYNVTLVAESKIVTGRKSSFQQTIIVRRGAIIDIDIV